MPAAGTCGIGPVAGAVAASGAATGAPGSWTNWVTDAATFLDSAGAVGLWLVNACAAAISSCVACSGLPAACWIIGLSCDKAGKPGNC